MNDATTERMWMTFREGCDALLNQVSREVPTVKMTARWRTNEHFPFRAYAEFAVNDRRVVVSLDVHKELTGLSVHADVCTENDNGSGHLISDLITSESISFPLSEDRLVRIVEDMASRMQDVGLVTMVQKGLQ